MTHKAGFVNIFGNPNVGKSTLLNAVLGQKIVITTPKAQTTRHRILGILNDETHQIVFSDTPGIIEPKYELQKAMMHAAYSVFQDADVLLGVITPRQISFRNKDFFQKLKNTEAPLILAINKVDRSNNTELEETTETWQKIFPNACIIPISALEKFGLDVLQQEIKQRLPIAPPYYAKDTLTDKPERFFVNELIREKILLFYQKEIPYSVEVLTESFKDEETIIRISSVVVVERKTQKAILIGKNGEALKKMATQARLDLEKFFRKKVFIRLHIKVIKDWRKNNSSLKSFGYTN